MEAERLSALVELDKAKADVEQYKKTILEGLKSQKAAGIEHVGSATGGASRIRSSAAKTAD